MIGAGEEGVLGDIITTVLAGLTTGEDVAWTLEMFTEAGAFSKFEGGKIGTQSQFYDWAKKNPKEAQIVVNTYKERTGKEFPWQLGTSGLTPAPTSETKPGALVGTTPYMQTQLDEITATRERQAAGTPGMENYTPEYYAALEKNIRAGMSYTNADSKTQTDLGMVTPAVPAGEEIASSASAPMYMAGTTIPQSTKTTQGNYTGQSA